MLWQLGWLLAANLAALAELAAEKIPQAPAFFQAPLQSLEAPERLADASRKARSVTQPWMDLTSQQQSWGLFAPDVNDQLSFPGVELIWNEEAKYPRCWLPSPNEPESLDGFFRVGRFRLRRYESCLSITPPLHHRHFDPARDSWPATVAQTVREHHRVIGAYLRWRLIAFEQAHPDLPPPAQVILCVQVYHIPEPPGEAPWHWEDLGRHPLARWQPRPGSSPEGQVLEMYNLLHRTFE